MGSLLRTLLTCLITVMFVSYSYSQTTGSGIGVTDTTETEGSGEDTTVTQTTTPDDTGTAVETTTTDDTDTAVETTTTDPCSLCVTGSQCPVSCNCTEFQDRKDENSICAYPCTEGYNWGCNPDTQDCLVNEGGDAVCECGSNFEGEGESCTRVLKFGGTMSFVGIYNASKEVEYEIQIKDILDTMFNVTDSGYLSSEVINVRSGSIIADYKLLYDYYSGATDDTVEDAFDEYTNDTCLDSSGTYNDNGSLPIMCSSRSTLINSTVLCEEYANMTGCDGITAICGNSNGTTTCVCQDTSRYEKPSPDAKFCLLINCTKNDDCNPPFGECNIHPGNRLENYCRCTVFGWSGTYCTNPWEFVFTIVTAGLGLILICVLTACIVTTRKSKTVQKTPKHEDMDLQNPFVDFQPGIVRAKVPTNAYSLSDSYEATNGAQSHTNGAFNANEGSQMQTSTFVGEQRASGKNDYEYF